MDMVRELPEAHRCDAIMVVINHLSKRAHFMPTTTTLIALGAARLYLWNVWKLPSLPQMAISDQGSQFVTKVTCKLSRMLSIKVAPSTTYHPQTNGNMERVNAKLEGYLQIFTNG